MLVLGTANRKKGIELADLFGAVGVSLGTLADFGGVKPVAEDGDTFAENAQLKAAGYARQVKRWVLADDSGLLVDALNGEPGVFSARYAGEQGNDASNNAKLLERLAGVSLDERTARFVCHMAVADPSGAIRAESEAACRGRILFEPRGAHGFGYDPLFEIVEYHRSFAEFGLLVKSHMSHRARAAGRMVPHLIRLADSGVMV